MKILRHYHTKLRSLSILRSLSTFSRATLPSRSASCIRCSRLAYLMASWTVRESGINSHSSDALISWPDLHASYTFTHNQRNCVRLYYIMCRSQISWKRLLIETRLKWSNDRKWHMANRMVTLLNDVTWPVVSDCFSSYYGNWPWPPYQYGSSLLQDPS